MNKTNKLFYHLGNILIALSLMIFIYIFYPILSIYLFPPKIQPILPKTGMYLTIPKISAQSPITKNVDPFNSDEYHKVLKKSIAHAKGSSLPGEPGTIFIFAHSSGPPWEQTRNNTIFLRLSELKNGDNIEIQREGKVYKYRVREKKEVYPNETDYLKPNPKDQVILQTCTPVGTDWKRLLVFADRSSK